MPHKIEFDKGTKQKISRAIFWLIFAFCVVSLIFEFAKSGGWRCPYIGKRPPAAMEKAK
jgi:hypothetical protein